MTTTPQHTVLVVDDEVPIVKALRRALDRRGYRPIVLTDPTKVMSVLETEPVDVIISDMDMPGVNGLDLLSFVRRRFPDIMRILLTGRGTLDSALQAINEGEVYRYLTKPWEEDELFDAIEKAVERRQELRRAEPVDPQVERRKMLLAELESEHPGISTLEGEGPRILDEVRLEGVAARLPSQELRQLVLG